MRSLIARAKTASGLALALIVPIALIFLMVAFFQGAATIGSWALPFLGKLAGFLFLLVLPLLLILAAPRRTRGFAGAGFYACSFVFGVTLWIWSLLYTLTTWGWFAVIIGVLMGGVGIVPIAMLAALFHAQWMILGQLFLCVAVVFACRAFGLFLIAKASEPTYTVLQSS